MKARWAGRKTTAPVRLPVQGEHGKLAEAALKRLPGTADLTRMGVNKPATDNWDDPAWSASIEEPLRGMPAASGPALVTELQPVARTLPAIRTIACWTLVLGAGLTVWTGAIYGLLRLLTEPLS